MEKKKKHPLHGYGYGSKNRKISGSSFRPAMASDFFAVEDGFRPDRGGRNANG